MTDVYEVYTAKEVELKTGISNQHIRRLIKEGKIEFGAKDVRQTEQGVFLFSQNALDKLIEYKSIDHRRKGKEDE